MLCLVLRVSLEVLIGKSFFVPVIGASADSIAGMRERLGIYSEFSSQTTQTCMSSTLLFYTRSSNLFIFLIAVAYSPTMASISVFQHIQLCVDVYVQDLRATLSARTSP